MTDHSTAAATLVIGLLVAVGIYALRTWFIHRFETLELQKNEEEMAEANAPSHTLTQSVSLSQDLKHTDRTWSAGVATIDGKEAFVVGQLGTTKIIAVTGYVGAADEAESIGNANRIEKCVNALADLPQLALDGGWTRAGLEAHNVKLGEQVIRLNGEAKVLRDLLELTLTPLGAVDPESTAEGDALKELTEKIIQALRVSPIATAITGAHAA